MVGIRRDSAGAAALAEALGDQRFTLIDIGCSGGIDGGWDLLGDRLNAYAFDPGQYEIERLREAETRPGVHYINAFVGLPTGHPFREAHQRGWRSNPWSRTAASRSVTLQRAREAGEPVPAVVPLARPTPEILDYETAFFDGLRDTPAPPQETADTGADQADLMSRNWWTEAVLADPAHPVVMPEFLAREGVGDIDFIKIDVDGPDFDILRSLGEALTGGRVLGAMLEVNFNGSADEHQNSFHNTDRFMRQHGFDLVDLSLRRYGLHVLPSAYKLSYPAQSLRGRPFQGDALYIRDFGYPSNGPAPDTWPEEKLIKSALICAMFGLLDHAAETLINSRDRLGERINVGGVLDLLAAESQALDAQIAPGGETFPTYADFIDAYEADHPALYQADLRRYAAAAAGERTAALEAEILALRSRAQVLQAVVEDITRSRVWRLTAPLRAIGARLKGR